MGSWAWAVLGTTAQWREAFLVLTDCLRDGLAEDRRNRLKSAAATMSTWWKRDGKEKQISTGRDGDAVDDDNNRWWWWWRSQHKPQVNMWHVAQRVALAPARCNNRAKWFCLLHFHSFSVTIIQNATMTRAYLVRQRHQEHSAARNGIEQALRKAARKRHHARVFACIALAPNIAALSWQLSREWRLWHRHHLGGCGSAQLGWRHAVQNNLRNMRATLLLAPHLSRRAAACWSHYCSAANSPQLLVAPPFQQLRFANSLAGVLIPPSRQHAVVLSHSLPRISPKLCRHSRPWMPQSPALFPCMPSCWPWNRSLYPTRNFHKQPSPKARWPFSLRRYQSLVLRQRPSVIHRPHAFCCYYSVELPLHSIRNTCTIPSTPSCTILASTTSIECSPIFGACYPPKPRVTNYPECTDTILIHRRLSASPLHPSSTLS